MKSASADWSKTAVPWKAAAWETLIVFAFYVAVLIASKKSLGGIPDVQNMLVFAVAFGAILAVLKHVKPIFATAFLTSSVFYIGSILHRTVVSDASDTHQAVTKALKSDAEDLLPPPKPPQP
jgi:hypothetical protein